jgi:hypothetical protein
VPATSRIGTEHQHRLIDDASVQLRLVFHEAAPLLLLEPCGIPAHPDALIASGQRPLELVAPVADDPMKIDFSSREIDVPGVQNLDAVIGHVPVEAWNRPVQCLPDLRLGEGLRDDPRTELVPSKTSLEEGEQGFQQIIPGLVEMAEVRSPRHFTYRLDVGIPEPVCHDDLPQSLPGTGGNLAVECDGRSGGTTRSPSVRICPKKRLVNCLSASANARRFRRTTLLHRGSNASHGSFQSPSNPALEQRHVCPGSMGTAVDAHPFDQLSAQQPGARACWHALRMVSPICLAPSGSSVDTQGHLHVSTAAPQRLAAWIFLLFGVFPSPMKRETG